MTRQQAGVSAEAVAKLVAKWREDGKTMREQSRGIFGKTHDKEIMSSAQAMEYCADELEALEAALATAPPEQAQDSLAKKGPSPELGNADERGHPSPARPGERSTGVEQPDRSSPESLPPQTASGEALEGVRYAGTRFFHPDHWSKGGFTVHVLTVDHPNGPWEAIFCNTEEQARAIEQLSKAALAAHDQKVRAEVLEEAAQEVLKLEKWGPLVPGLEHPFQDSASAIRSLASGAVERGK